MKLAYKQLAGIMVVGTLIVSGSTLGECMTRTVQVAIDSVKVTVNGSLLNIDTIFYNNTTYVPLRKVSEELSAEVTWDASTNTAKIKSNTDVNWGHASNTQIYNVEFFPDKTFDNKGITKRWYSEQLSALQEPSLYKLSADKKAISYRFLYLRSFDKPISIRVDINSVKNFATLYYKRCDGTGGNDPGLIDDVKKVQLTKTDIQKLIDKIDKEGFWSMESTERRLGCDGAEWIIEAVDEGKYHFVDRWEPNNGLIREIGLLFLSMAKVDMSK